jgi:hypothetical protein
LEHETRNSKKLVRERSALAESKEAIEQFCSNFRQWAEACITPLETDSEETTKWRKHSGELGVY